MFITNGALAELYFVAARGEAGISVFAVERGAPGLSVGRRLEKMGWRSSDTAELVFDDCPAELVGEEGRGFYAVMKNFQNERIALGAMAMGEAAKALELTLDYVKGRKAFGSPLWEKQAIRQRLAQRAAEIEAARALVYHAASLDAQGRDCVKEVSMVKALCGELVNRVTYDCLQFHGGLGFIRDSAIERMARDARIHSIGGGATEVMLEEVAKRL
jgi:acyl-CoA dehydrogenase